MVFLCLKMKSLTILLYSPYWRKWRAPHFRHAKASHWIQDGLNVLQVSFLLGHTHLETTMVYLDITTEDKAKALATLENENDKKITKKWKNPDGSLIDFWGLKK